MQGFAPEVVYPVLGALCAGAVVGLEREFRGEPAGLRTHILVCLGACFLMLTTVQPVGGALASGLRIDPGRMAQGILTGVGFVCGGVIFRTATSVHGLTTAASLWFCSVLGLLFGLRLYGQAIEATVLVLIVLSVLRVLDELMPREVLSRLIVRFARDTAPAAPEFKAELNGLGLKSGVFTQKLIEHGALIEFSTDLSTSRRRSAERLLQVLRDDARVKEFELYPRKT